MAGKRYALLIASGTYADGGLSSLRAPAGDARALGSVLSDPLIGDFEVGPVLIDRATDDVKQAIVDFFDGHHRDDLLLVYISGHGVLSPMRRLYFAMANTDRRRLRTTAIEESFLNESMDDSRARSIVLVLDCCHSGAFAGGLAPKGSPTIDIERRFEGDGRTILTASTALEYAFEEIAADEPTIHPLGTQVPGSLFTRFLVEGLRNGDADTDRDGQVSVDELYHYAFKRVQEVAPQQTPGKRGAGHGLVYIASNPNHTPALPAHVHEAIDQALTDRLPEIRWGAVRRLEQMLGGDPEPAWAPSIRKALGQALEDDSKAVVTAARKALGRATEDDSKPVVTAARNDLGRAAEDDSKPVVTAARKAPERVVATKPGGGGDGHGAGSTQAINRFDRFPRRAWMAAAAAALVIGLVVAVLLLGGGQRFLTPAQIASAAGPVTYCTGADTVTSTDGQTQHATDIAGAEKAYPTLKITRNSSFSNNASDQYQQFNDPKLAGSCDVFYADVTFVAHLAHDGGLQDLSHYFKAAISKYVPAMQKASEVGTKVYGLPKQADAGLLYYRKDRFPTAPTTWQAVYDDAAGHESLRYQAADYEGLTVNFLELAYAAGASPVVRADGTADFDQPKVVAALQFMVDGIHRRNVAPIEVTVQKEGSGVAAFQQGKADFLRNWSSAYAALQSPTYPKVAGNFAAAPLPRWQGLAGHVEDDTGHVLGGHILVISGHTHHLAAALKLVEYLASEQVVQADALKFSLAPPRTDWWSPQVRAALPAPDDLEVAIEHAQSRPLTPNYAAVSQAIAQNVNSALTANNDITPAAAVRQANSVMNAALKAPYEPYN